MLGSSRTGGKGSARRSQPRERRAPRLRRPLLGLLACGAVLGTGFSEAHADKDLVLFLSLRSRQHHDGRLTQQLAQRLVQSGERLVADRAISVVERDCDTEGCMSQLASREEARYVLRTSIEAKPGAPPQLSAVVFDPEKAQSIDENGRCMPCTTDDQLRMLADLAGRALARAREQGGSAAGGQRSTKEGAPLIGTRPKPQPASGEQGGARETEAPLVAPAPKKSSLWPPSPGRKIAAGVLGGLGIASLATAIALHLTDGHETPLPCGDRLCILDNKIPYTAGYAVTGAMAAGIILSLVWPSSSPEAAKPAEEAPSPSPSAASPAAATSGTTTTTAVGTIESPSGSQDATPSSSGPDPTPP